MSVQMPPSPLASNSIHRASALRGGPKWAPQYTWVSVQTPSSWRLSLDDFLQCILDSKPQASMTLTRTPSLLAMLGDAQQRHCTIPGCNCNKALQGVNLKRCFDVWWRLSFISALKRLRQEDYRVQGSIVNSSSA